MRVKLSRALQVHYDYYITAERERRLSRREEGQLPEVKWREQEGKVKPLQKQETENPPVEPRSIS